MREAVSGEGSALRRCDCWRSGESRLVERRATFWRGLLAQQAFNSPRNRIAAIDPIKRIGRSLRQLITQKREVSAGEDDRINRITLKQGCGFSRNNRHINRLAAQLSFGLFNQSEGAFQPHITIRSVAFNQIINIGTAHGARGSKNRDTALFRRRGRRFDRRHNANHRNIQHRAHRWQSGRGRSVAGDNHNIGPKHITERREQVRQAGANLRFCLFAVRPERIIREVALPQVRQAHTHVAAHGEAANAGIKYERVPRGMRTKQGHDNGSI